MTRPTWHDEPTADAVVRWTSVSGHETAWLTLADALDRLAGYGYDRAEVLADLMARRPIHTPYAMYTHEPEAAS